MTTYAAIRLTKDTISTILGNVAEVPAGNERLIWAMLNYPYQPGIRHYYIGGNYLKLSQPDYSRQILNEAELDRLFKYHERPAKVNGRVDPSRQWFPVKLRENSVKENSLEPCST